MEAKRLVISAVVFHVACLSYVFSYPLTTKCPSQYCNPDKCKVEDCPEGYILKPNTTNCGCCPSCLKQLGRGDPCRRLEVPQTSECGASFICSEKSGTCVPVDYMLGKQSLPCNPASRTSWGGQPVCSRDGSYAPTQCAGKACFCVTHDGTVLPYHQPVKLAKYMDCICAREEHAVSRFTAIENSTCNEFGNYLI